MAVNPLASSMNHFYITTAARAMTQSAELRRYTGCDTDVTLRPIKQPAACLHRHMRPRQETVMAGGADRRGRRDIEIVSRIRVDQGTGGGGQDAVCGRILPDTFELIGAG